MMTYRYNEQLHIIETVITGEITINDFTEYIRIISEEPYLSDNLKIMTDAINAKFSKNTQVEDLHKIIEANNKYLLSKSNHFYNAIILSGSLETALGYLYREYSRADNYTFSVFSTKKAAMEWLEKV